MEILFHCDFICLQQFITQYHLDSLKQIFGMSDKFKANIWVNKMCIHLSFSTVP